MESGRLDAAQLWEHERALRGLAQRLVKSDHLAEDLVQETYIVALQKPAPAGATTGAWLRGILRNVARNARRGWARRDKREASAPGPTEPLPPDQIAADLDLRRALVATVRGLGEPYRTAVYLRYFQMYSPGEIAGQLDVPLATVKTRLRRALDLLRARLDRHHGRHAWTAAVAGWLHGDPKTPNGSRPRSTPSPLGVVWSLGFGATLLLLAALVMWLSSPDGPEPSLLAGAVQADPHKRAVPALRGQTSLHPRSPTDSQRRRARVRGQVLLSDGRPAAGAVVSARAPAMAPVVVTADEAGLFELRTRAPIGAYVSLHAVAADGTAAGMLTGGCQHAGVDLPSLILVCSAANELEVTCATEDGVLAGARVIARRRELAAAEDAVFGDAYSDADGVVSFRGLPAGTYDLIAAYPGLGREVAAVEMPLEPQAVPVRLQMSAEVPIMVEFTWGGRPVPPGLVCTVQDDLHTAGGSYSGQVRCMPAHLPDPVIYLSQEGRAAVRGVPRVSELTVKLQASEASWPFASEPIRISLRRVGARLTGSHDFQDPRVDMPWRFAVTDARGEPLADGAVVERILPTTGGFTSREECAVAAGQVEFHRVWRLPELLRGPGGQLALVGPEPGVSHSTKDVVSAAVFQPERALEVVLRDSLGRPLVGALVCVSAAEWGDEPYQLAQKATDQRGFVEFRGLPACEVLIELEHSPAGASVRSKLGIAALDAPRVTVEAVVPALRQVALRLDGLDEAFPREMFVYLDSSPPAAMQYDARSKTLSVLTRARPVPGASRLQWGARGFATTEVLVERPEPGAEWSASLALRRRGRLGVSVVAPPRGAAPREGEDVWHFRGSTQPRVRLERWDTLGRRWNVVPVSGSSPWLRGSMGAAPGKPVRGVVHQESSVFPWQFTLCELVEGRYRVVHVGTGVSSSAVDVRDSDATTWVKLDLSSFRLIRVRVHGLPDGYDQHRRGGPLPVQLLLAMEAPAWLGKPAPPSARRVLGERAREVSLSFLTAPIDEFGTHEVVCWIRGSPVLYCRYEGFRPAEDGGFVPVDDLQETYQLRMLPR